MADRRLAALSESSELDPTKSPTPATNIPIRTRLLSVLDEVVANHPSTHAGDATATPTTVPNDRNTFVRTLEGLTPVQEKTSSPPSLVKPTNKISRASDGQISKDDLSQHLAWTHTLLERNDITPVSRRLLIDYHNLLEDVAKGIKTETSVFDVIKAKESELLTHEHYRTTMSKQMKQLTLQLLKYKKLELYARYGDYLNEQTSKLRAQIRKLRKELELEPDKIFEDFWSVISQEIKVEEALYTQPVTDMIHKAADVLKWSHKHAEFCVHQYANRNNLMHAGIYDLVREQEWMEIGRRCEGDFAVLENIFQPSEKEACDEFKIMIQRFRDRFVERVGPGWVAIKPIDQATRAPHNLTELDDIKAMSELGPNATADEINNKIDELKRKRAEVPESAKAAAVKGNMRTDKLKEKLKAAEEDKATKDEEIQALKDELKVAQDGKAHAERLNDFYRLGNDRLQRTIQELKDQLEAEKARRPL